MYRKKAGEWVLRCISVLNCKCVWDKYRDMIVKAFMILKKKYDKWLWDRKWI